MTANWPIQRLGDLCNIRSGGTPSKANAAFWNGAVPWVSPKDMKSDVIVDSIDHISEEALLESAAPLIPSGSLLVVVRSGILARTVPVAMAGVDLAINQDLKALEPTAEVLPRFLWYALRSAEDELLAEVSRGATVHRLETSKLASLRIAVPPLAVQEELVVLLDQALSSIADARRSSVLKLEALDELQQVVLRQGLAGSLSR